MPIIGNSGSPIIIKEDGEDVAIGVHIGASQYYPLRSLPAPEPAPVPALIPYVKNRAATTRHIDKAAPQSTSSRRARSTRRTKSHHRSSRNSTAVDATDGKSTTPKANRAVPPNKDGNNLLNKAAPLNLGGNDVEGFLEVLRYMKHDLWKTDSDIEGLGDRFAGVGQEIPVSFFGRRNSAAGANMGTTRSQASRGSGRRG